MGVRVPRSPPINESMRLSTEEVNEANRIAFDQKRRFDEIKRHGNFQLRGFGKQPFSSKEMYNILVTDSMGRPVFIGAARIDELISEMALGEHWQANFQAYEAIK